MDVLGSDGQHVIRTTKIRTEGDVTNWIKDGTDRFDFHVFPVPTNVKHINIIALLI
jgi:hypothetical protein